MNSTTFEALVTVAADYFFAALKATEDLDTFLKDVHDGMRQAACSAVTKCIERFDREVASQVPNTWKLHAKEKRTVITMFGKVTYTRSRYRDEYGCNRYLTDEILGIPKRKRLTTDVFLWLAARAARVSFRQTVKDFADISGVDVSAMCAWRTVQQAGKLIADDLKSGSSQNISQEDIFAECDGIYIALQTPKRRNKAIERFFYEQTRKKKSIELKAGCVYAGKYKVGKRVFRGNVALFASTGTAEQMREGMRATIASDYNIADIKRVHYSSDGGSWCLDSGLDGIGESIKQGLDLYHVMRYIHQAFPDGTGREHLVSLALRRKPEALVKAIDRMILQVTNAKRRDKMYTCRNYIAKHADLLRAGGSLGTMEATNAYVWAKRMKSFGCSWSVSGANNMALVLCRICANRSLVPPPKDVWLTAKEKAKEAKSLAKRGAQAAAQLTVGKGWEPPQHPKALTKNVAIPLYCRI